MSETKTSGRSTALDPERWVDEHGDVLYRYALMRMGDSDAAAELVQDTFLEAFRTREAFAGRSTERTWLIAILRHRIVDHFRRERRTSRRLGTRTSVEGTGHDGESPALFDARGHWKQPPARWGGDPGRLHEQREFWEVVEGCLGRLPASLSLTFWLREVDGLSGEEVCLTAGISPANLWARLHRARLLLRDCLERHWFRDDDLAPAAGRPDSASTESPRPRRPGNRP